MDDRRSHRMHAKPSLKAAWVKERWEDACDFDAVKHRMLEKFGLPKEMTKGGENEGGARARFAALYGGGNDKG
jgi:hypothetical protein